ncbi:MAG: CYTH and CHAD domain-containing protein, partial [Arthrobacter sp.]
EPREERLEAVYFDTAGLALAARRITLRRRTGGTDHGWHLKIPAGQDHRVEFQAPLGQPETVPAELADHLAAYLRGQDVGPVARLTTQRTTYALYGPDGQHLADFADDYVEAESFHGALDQQWREWEIELVHGAEALFAAATGPVTATGAQPSGHVSKLARALGGSWPQENNSGAAHPRKEGPAVHVVTAYLDGQINELLTDDAGVRQDKPDAVHAMRSATRRGRSALATYRKLFNKTEAKKTTDELKWLARILGGARDAEVLASRLRQHSHDLELTDTAGNLPALLDQDLTTAYNTGYQKVLETLGMTRYYKLLDSLENFRDHPPASYLAARPARKMTAKLVDKTNRRLSQARKAVPKTKTNAERDAAPPLLSHR